MTRLPHSSMNPVLPVSSPGMSGLLNSAPRHGGATRWRSRTTPGATGTRASRREDHVVSAQHPDQCRDEYAVQHDYRRDVPGAVALPATSWASSGSKRRISRNADQPSARTMEWNLTLIPPAAHIAALRTAIRDRSVVYDQ